jgi:nicotinamidase-related amidase
MSAARPGSDREERGGPKTALVCVDVQTDFLPGGALGVPHGDTVIGPLVDLARRVDLVVASRDWHPEAHTSFRSQGGIWPRHCVAGTPGAEIDPAIATVADVVVSKATDAGADAYSAFDGTGLAELLRQHGVEELWVGGLATDYCVRATVLDALREGFRVSVDPATVAAVDVTPGDGERALEEMRTAGARLAASASAGGARA